MHFLRRPPSLDFLVHDLEVDHVLHGKALLSSKVPNNISAATGPQPPVAAAFRISDIIKLTFTIQSSDRSTDCF